MIARLAAIRLLPTRSLYSRYDNQPTTKAAAMALPAVRSSIAVRIENVRSLGAIHSNSVTRTTRSLTWTRSLRATRKLRKPNRARSGRVSVMDHAAASNRDKSRAADVGSHAPPRGVRLQAAIESKELSL